MESAEKIAFGALVMSGLALFVSVVAALYSRRQALAAEASIPPPPPRVAWRLERRDQWLYVLRNVGTDTATGVRIDLPDAVLTRRLQVSIGDHTVAPNASVEIRTFPMLNDLDLHELPVIWDGQASPVSVPFPPEPTAPSAG